MSTENSNSDPTKTTATTTSAATTTTTAAAAAAAGGGGGESKKSPSKESSNSKPKIDVAIVIDLQIKDGNLSHRMAAFEEIKKACHMVNANYQLIAFHKLDFDEINAIDAFHAADVAIVDLSIQNQQHSLFYRIGNRENFGMKYNILIFNDDSLKVTIPSNLPISTFNLISYRLSPVDKKCYYTESLPDKNSRNNSNPNIRSSTNRPPPLSCETKILLSTKLRNALQHVEIQTKTHLKEKFLSELRKARETLTRDELTKSLHDFRKKLENNSSLISADIVHNLLVSYREIQDYDSMVSLIEEVQSSKFAFKFTPPFQYLHAFALNRRNQIGDRERALEKIHETIEESSYIDSICLAGRIYKDKFIESQYQDKESLEQAIIWYRKGFDHQPNEYAGINLATLLVIRGDDLNNSTELKDIASILNLLIGRKGSLKSIQDYWDVATFLEISVLAENYTKANESAECMFNLKPPEWYLNSTLRNIQLINDFRKKPEDVRLTPEEELFRFWMEYFIEAAKDHASHIIRFPVIIQEIDKSLIPSYVTVNQNDQDGKSLQINNICKECIRNPDSCRRPHNWLFHSSKIRGVNEYRKRFHELVLDITANEECLDLDSRIMESIRIQFDYDYDEKMNKIKLGEGSYGTVYAAHDSNNIAIAVKEIPIKNKDEVQPLQEEIKLHSQLKHRNIVKYIGSINDEQVSVFKILMERVPGGSLSQLLRCKWGPLKESSIAYYTRQILDGLHYLHSQNIVHRDIKGDNVLVNTYTGDVKISDFGTSKRLAGLNPRTETFTGTFQYMAPEVIDQGARGYAAPADIWSLGCTVVEMATGKTPFIELSSGHEVIFKVGYFKQHPEIPGTLSEKCRNFIESCFEPNPAKRPAAAELLEMQFMECGSSSSRKRKPANQLQPKNNNKVNPNRMSVDFNRSISMPYDPTLKSTDSSSSTTAVIDIVQQQQQQHNGGGGGGDHTPNSMDSLQDSNPFTLMPSTISGCGGGGNKNPNSRLQTNLSLNINNLQNSSGDEKSPNIMTSGSSVAYPVTPNDLTMNEHNIQKSLSQVLDSNTEDITEVWWRRLIENWPDQQLLLQSRHIQNVLFPGFRDYISTNKNTLYLMNALYSLANEFNEKFNSTNDDHDDGEDNDDHDDDDDDDSVQQQQQQSLDNDENKRFLFKQLQTAIYYFQDAIDSILKIQNIPPHWIFALDSLIRESVQEAQRLLHLCYKNVFEIEMAGSEVAVPQSAGCGGGGDLNHLINVTSPSTADMLRHSQESLFNMQLIKSDHFKQEIKHLLQENNKTVKLLSDTFSEYLAEQNEVLRRLCEKVQNQNRPNLLIDNAVVVSASTNVHTNDDDGGSGGDIDKNSDDNQKFKDETMITMLENENISRSTIDALIRQDIDRKVLFEFISRDDLRKLNLTLGEELRLWNLIEKNKIRYQLVNNNNDKYD
ncbi:mitogen-activated protein kinase kinase kinase 5-like protein [Dermatophagoides farinae]|uniref:Mitogen-activated protein kinase kinase kinase 5-like protein n=1 Tax=Dermatophagoides farinae TaxID=6954 RepID=A0A9D4NWV1_DERFA|nr:mitogen-activated protein kinase kinase kinase 5-like protein [Dermatophagoides farinae]